MDKSTTQNPTVGGANAPAVDESIRLDWQCIWERRLGLIVIEMHDDRMLVNGYPADLTS